jgi:hypothetical protein
MAYVRSKKIRREGREYTYYQLVRGYRENGSVKQEVVAHLGRNETPEAALTEWEGRGQWYRDHAADYLHAAEYIRQGRYSPRYVYGQRRKGLVPRAGTPLDSEAPPPGGFALSGWFYFSGASAEDAEAEAAEYIAKAEVVEERAARLRAVL